MESSASHNKPSYHHEKHAKSSSELLSSAKLVAEAAKNTLHHGNDKVDKGKVAGAAADLLDAASHYGKLDQQGVGKYVEKAENYLHHYHSSHSIPTTTHSGAHSTKPEKHSESHASGGDGHDSGSGGYGDYMKMAQGFLKKY